MSYEDAVNGICDLRERVQADYQYPTHFEWQCGFAAAIRDVLITLERLQLDEEIEAGFEGEADDDAD